MPLLLSILPRAGVSPAADSSSDRSSLLDTGSTLDQQRAVNQCPEHTWAARGHMFSESDYPDKHRQSLPALGSVVKRSWHRGPYAGQAGVGQLGAVLVVSSPP